MLAGIGFPSLGLTPSGHRFSSSFALGLRELFMVVTLGKFNNGNGGNVKISNRGDQSNASGHRFASGVQQ